MHPKDIEQLLNHVKSGDISVDVALEELKQLPFVDLLHTKIDAHRHHRTGVPEVIYGLHKTDEQILDIIDRMVKLDIAILATRIKKNTFDKIILSYPNAIYNELGQVLRIPPKNLALNVYNDHSHYVAIVSAGTSDQYVVEEAYETVCAMGYKAVKVLDVGVAGIHRLFAKLDMITGASVIIVVAGMEGALASVVGGLTDKPIIAVPTSVGYGVSFKGVSALLTMLNSCSSGITVVNIDNGFGAGYAAAQILRLL